MPKSTKSLERTLTLELARITEAAAIAAARLIGRGDEKAADQAAVDAMREALNGIDIDGTVVIGEGERDEAPMLYIGEKVGTGLGPKVDIALDPLEGTTLTAKAMANALAVVAIAEGGTLLHAPDVYMDKIAIGGGYPEGIIQLDADPADNIKALAKAKGCRTDQITACILDRPRHSALIQKVRATGAAIRLIPDGDIAGVINTADPATGIDIYIGIGGAPEGVLAAAALRAVGGQFQGRLLFKDDDERARAHRIGITDLDKVYLRDELASGDVMFAATGVTDGSMLDGIHEVGGFVTSHSVIMRSKTKTVRWIKARHVPKNMES
ncbi:MAG: class II fructose-bisphosphatase [Alphaproteobacteria bacterium]|nr:class II fructose-bisphosphatase [Alphaproteobacteria bacterium]